MFTEEQIIAIRQELELTIYNLNILIFKRNDVFPYEDNESINYEAAEEEINRLLEYIDNERS